MVKMNPFEKTVLGEKKLHAKFTGVSLTGGCMIETKPLTKSTVKLITHKDRG